MRKIVLTLLISITFLAFPSGNKEITTPKLLPLEYKETRGPLSLTNDELDTILYKVKYYKEKQDWLKIIELSEEVYKTDFNTISDEKAKAYYLQIYIHKLMAHKERLRWDIIDFKSAYRYLISISNVYPKANDVVKLFSATYTSIKPPSEPWIIPYSNTNVTGEINAIEPLPDGTGFVTGGNDKTLRFWDKNFDPVKQIYIPANSDQDGTITAIAIHPTETIIACGGRTSWDWEGRAHIYYINYSTGDLLKIIPVEGSIPTSLRFSKDGNYLIQGNSVDGLFSLHSTLDWSMKGSSVGDSTVNSIEVLDESFILLSSNGVLKKYDYDLNLLTEKSFTNEDSVYSMDLSPEEDKLVLTVSNDRTLILQSDNFQTITFLYKSRNIKYVKWSKNGSIYGTGGIFRTVNSGMDRSFGMFRWLNFNVNDYDYIHIGKSDSKVFTPLDSGNVVFINKYRDLGLVTTDAHAKIVRRHNKVIFNTNLGDQFFYGMPKGSEIAFKTKNGHFYKFNLEDKSLSVIDNYTAIKPTHKHGDNSIVTGSDTAINGVKINLPYTTSGTLLYKEDKVLWATASGLYKTDISGNKLWYSKNLDSTCMAVYASYDGRFAIGAFDDGSIKYYNLNNGKLLFTVIIDHINMSWIIYTPDGYYDTSDKHGATLAAWYLNNTYTDNGKTAELDQFKENYFRPDLINSLINMKKNNYVIADDIPELWPPSITKFKMGNKYLEPGVYNIPVYSKTSLDAVINIESSSPDIKGLEIYYNDRALSLYKLTVNKQAVVKLLKDGSYEVKISLPVTEINNKFRIFVKDANGLTSKERVFKIYYPDIEKTPKFILKKEKKKAQDLPTKHILLAGVSNYRYEELVNLKYKDRDISELKSSFEAISENHSDMKLYALSRSITGKKISTSHILSSLDRIKKSLKENDDIIIYLSGHGIKRFGEYYFLTSEADLTSKESLDNSSISFRALQQQLKTMDIAENITLMLDTFYLEDISPRELGYMLNNSGFKVVLSSNDNQLSQESSNLKHGLFAYSLIEALKRSDSRENFNDILEYMMRKTDTLSLGEQSPWTPG